MKRSNRAGQLGIFLTLVGSALAIAAPIRAASLSREARERAEVRAIFATLLSQMEPGDGPSHGDLPCVFPETWDDFVSEKGKTTRPNALLSPREALDPKGEHPQRFCDFAVRNAQAAEMAKELPKDRLSGITTADMRFSYPIFDRSLTHAVVRHTGSNQLFLRNGTRTMPAASFRNIYLTKKNGVWTARFELFGVT